ncbi:c-type cytochrome [Rhodoferax sp.]|uniref:c-type cytochrome n=1 Tax=Rhodoferax sp. TaxID=50421 RepID=UPI00374CD2B4
MNMRLLNAIPMLALLAYTGQAAANEALARKNDCMGCHAVAVQLVGPAYKDVAAKYKGDPEAVAKLVKSIREGSTGVWGQLAMPAHPKISEADLQKLATWVLSTK